MSATPSGKSGSKNKGKNSKSPRASAGDGIPSSTKGGGNDHAQAPTAKKDLASVGQSTQGACPQSKGKKQGEPAAALDTGGADGGSSVGKKELCAEIFFPPYSQFS